MMHPSFCPTYLDGEHCFVAGYLRTVSASTESYFAGSLASRCTDDLMFQHAKQCACGMLVIGKEVQIEEYDPR